MAANDFLFQGTTGNTVGDGTAASPANTGCAQTPAPSPGSIIHRTAAKHPGSTLGLRMTASTAGAVIAETNPTTTSLVMARTTALTLPALPSTGFVSIWTLRSTTPTILRLNWYSTGHLQLSKVSGSLVDLGVFTAGQKISAQCFVTAATSTTGHLDFQIQAEGGATISGTSVTQTNADLGTTAIVAGYVGFTAATTDALVLDYGPDRWESGRTSFIPQLTDASAPTITGYATATDANDGWTATPSGTVLAVVSDSDVTTAAVSPAGPVTERKIRYSIGSIIPKSILQIPINWAASGGTAGNWYVRLFDGATLKATWTGLVADGLPSLVQTDSTVAAGLTQTSGAWSGLHVEFGYGP